jgi:hypothetical protein
VECARLPATRLHRADTVAPPPSEEPEEKKKVAAPVVRADLNVGGSDGGDMPGVQSPSLSGDMPRVVVVRRPDLNVGSSGEDTATVVGKKNFRPDLNVGSGESGEEEGGGSEKGRKHKTKKEKKDKGKKEKGSGIKGNKKGGSKINSSASVNARSRSGSTADDERWPTDPSILAKIASALPVPAATTTSHPEVPPPAPRRSNLDIRY